jgi:hypothetical protein
MIDENEVLSIFRRALDESRIRVPQEVRIQIQIQILFVLNEKPSYRAEYADEDNYSFARKTFNELTIQLEQEYLSEGYKYIPNEAINFNASIIRKIFDKICPRWPLC